MKKEVYIIAFVAAVLILAVIYQPEARKSIFTERLGDMSLIRYETGEVPAQEIKNIYGLKDIPLAKGYSAVYMGRNGTMRVLVVEAGNHNIANDAFNSMNSMLGSSGGHAAHEYSGDVGSGAESREIAKDSKVIQEEETTKPEKVDFMDFTKPDVFTMKDGSRYSYYYLKMDYKTGRVYWITFDYPDAGYQRAMVRQAIFKI
ncbi:MAG: hypothetical protein WC568_05395 [Candidatus Methanoperedens sp.]